MPAAIATRAQYPEPCFNLERQEENLPNYMSRSRHYGCIVMMVRIPIAEAVGHVAAPWSGKKRSKTPSKHLAVCVAIRATQQEHRTLACARSTFRDWRMDMSSPLMKTIEWVSWSTPKEKPDRDNSSAEIIDKGSGRWRKSSGLKNYKYTNVTADPTPASP